MRRNRARGIRGLALRAATLLGLAALAAGCGGSDEEQPRQVGAAGGLKVYEVASQGFELGLPPEWKVSSVDQALPAAERERLARENPEFAEAFEAVGSDESPVKLLAFDPKVEKEFATNVNVIAVPLPNGTTLEEFVEANRADLAGLESIQGDVDSEPVELPAGPGERMQYRLGITTEGEQLTVSTTQYYVVAGDRGYIVTFSTLPELLSRHEPEFERIAESLRLD